VPFYSFVKRKRKKSSLRKGGKETHNPPSSFVGVRKRYFLFHKKDSSSPPNGVEEAISISTVVGKRKERGDQPPLGRERKIEGAGSCNT